MKTGTKIAIGAGVFLLLRGRGSTATATTAAAGTDPFAALSKALTSILKPQSASASKGAPAGQGASATAGRGGDPKIGGGIQDVFGSFDNIGGLNVIPQQNPFNRAPDLSTDFLQDPNGVSNIITTTPTGDNAVPQFGGDQNLIDPVSGLVIDPSTGFPFGQESTDTVTTGGFFPEELGPPSPDEVSIPVPDIFEGDE